MIPQEAIGAARAALFEEAAKVHEGWDERNDALVTAAIKAAAPFLRAQALTEAAEALELPGSGAVGYYSSYFDSGYDEAERHAESWLKARAATERGDDASKD